MASNQQRIEATVACQNAIKDQNRCIAEMRGELEEVRLLLQGFYDMNTKAGAYVAWLRERAYKRLS
jgi:hypothetical protein